MIDIFTKYGPLLITAMGQTLLLALYAGVDLIVISEVKRGSSGDAPMG